VGYLTSDLGNGGRSAGLIDEGDGRTYDKGGSVKGGETSNCKVNRGPSTKKDKGKWEEGADVGQVLTFALVRQVRTGKKK